MSFQFDPNQQGQFQPESNGQAPQGMQQQQQPLQQNQDGGPDASFAQQGDNSGSVSGDAKTTLWYVIEIFLLSSVFSLQQFHVNQVICT